ncbi:hypothetical protein NLG97_g11073 [Lecanicillium saksenae]|uniref:Uncharacterized protein n=1 Tax=Lecanicillium saksenae TaxID=468837 RepID=A0ACC1QBK1_9HYPO|nr:hypothetical protein NLG97_g11073 [Lecanicillium saksenae]
MIQAGVLPSAVLQAPEEDHIQESAWALVVALRWGQEVAAAAVVAAAVVAAAAVAAAAVVAVVAVPAGPAVAVAVVAVQEVHIELVFAGLADQHILAPDSLEPGLARSREEQPCAADARCMDTNMVHILGQPLLCPEKKPCASFRRPILLQERATTDS